MTTATWRNRPAAAGAARPRVGNAVRSVEFPGPAQHPRGDVEKTVAQIMALTCKVDQRCRFLVHIDRRAAMFMDPGGNAVVSIAAEFLLDSQRLLRRDGADRQRRLVLHHGQKHLARTGHGDEFDRKQMLAPRFGHQRRVRCIAKGFLLGWVHRWDCKSR